MRNWTTFKNEILSDFWNPFRRVYLGIKCILFSIMFLLDSDQSNTGTGFNQLPFLTTQAAVTATQQCNNIIIRYVKVNLYSMKRLETQTVYCTQI